TKLAVNWHCCSLTIEEYTRRLTTAPLPSMILLS
ncbi:unnamed protein product, partial [Rotaria sp. Silwood2]